MDQQHPLQRAAVPGHEETHTGRVTFPHITKVTLGIWKSFYFDV